MTAELDARLRKYLDAVRHRLFREPIRGLFATIPSLDRRLFALQRYVEALRDPTRGQTWIDGRWAMTRAEFEEWRASVEGVLRDHELRGIVARFNAAHTGFRLVPGSEFRSLDEQRRKWNAHPTVGAHAATLLARARREINKVEQYPDLGIYLHEPSGLLSHIAAPPGGIPGIAPGMLMQTLRSPGVAAGAMTAAAETFAQREQAIERFAQWLAIRRTWKPKLTIATLGLSDHGVGHAIDFQVHQDGVGRILGARSGPARWRSGPWAERLAEAVRRSPHFTGPLLSPDEPWHWTFDATP